MKSFSHAPCHFPPQLQGRSLGEYPCGFLSRLSSNWLERQDFRHFSREIIPWPDRPCCQETFPDVPPTVSLPTVIPKLHSDNVFYQERCISQASHRQLCTETTLSPVLLTSNWQVVNFSSFKTLDEYNYFHLTSLPAH